MAWLVLDAVSLRLGYAREYGGELQWTPVSREAGTWQEIAVSALRSGGRSLTDISHITVIQGKASFSDTRFVTVLANLAAWAKQGVRLFEVVAEKPYENPLTAAEIAEQGQEVQQFAPRYSGEPNITKPKAE